MRSQRNAWLAMPLLALSSVPFLATGCGDAVDVDVLDHHAHEDEDETVGSTASALEASDPVSAAVSQTCTTRVVRPLVTQLVEEIQCLRPGTMKSIAGVPGLSLGAAAFPFLQTSAADALIAAQKTRGTTMSINSGLRTLPDQYLLYRWYQQKRCGIRLAAKPGTSNHESGIAVDINDNAGWRSAMQKNGYRWLGAHDPVHFDYVGGGTVKLSGLSVLAFQRLWNRNNPDDLIDEDGSYGPITEARLTRSPIGGFPIGARCDDEDGDDDDPSEYDGDEEVEDMGEPPVVPDATEPDPEGDAFDPDAPFDDASGCAVSNGPPVRGLGHGALAALAFGAAALRRRRRGPRPTER